MRRAGEVEVVTSGQALEAGVTWRDLQGPAYRRVLRGVYVRRGAVVDAVVMTRAVRLVVGDLAIGSRHTAAEIWGGVVPPTDEVHVTVPPGTTRTQRTGVRVHVARRPSAIRRGVPVTPPVKTFLDLAGRLPLVDLVVLATPWCGPASPRRRSWSRQPRPGGGGTVAWPSGARLW